MKRIKTILLIILAVAAALVITTLIYFGVYYHADDAAAKALESSGNVTVTAIDEGYLFDGEGEAAAVIFYPGAKVEAEAYAPLMRDIAERGTDCFLCTMPLNFALFDKDRADRIAAAYDYDRWFIAGHSLGGATAAMLAESEDDPWDGLILLAAYPVGEVDEPVLSIYGTEDGVLNMKKYAAAAENYCMPEQTTELIIQGGNHAGFGSYGAQKGDGEATITADQQQTMTADAITEFIYN